MGKIIVINGADFSANSLGTVTPSEKVFVNVIPNVMGRGTVSGSGGYDEGDTVQISATAKVGYRFVKWSDNNTNAVRNITVGSQNLTLVAIFAIYEGTVLTVSETKLKKQLSSTTAEEVEVNAVDFNVEVYNLPNTNPIRIIHSGMTGGSLKCNYAVYDSNGVMLLYKNNPSGTYVAYSYDDFIELPNNAAILKVSVNINETYHDGISGASTHFLEVRQY